MLSLPKLHKQMMATFFLCPFLLFPFLFAGCSRISGISVLQAQRKELPKDPPKLKLSDPLPANLFSELARVANPAVVNISTQASVNLRRGRSRDPFFQMLEELYGLRQDPQPRRPLSLGTGFIIREDGLIVTNNHVIQGADVISVQLSEKSTKNYDATVIGNDERTDIALIRIEGTAFPTLTLGSSATTEVGEWVAAFGNPFGNGHTMTKGIISAKGRDINEINRFPLLQTDAPINPGNSGGPLVNSKGQVIGVNSAIDGRAQGIGFAIPIDEVKAILPTLEKVGRLKKGYLGVALGNLDPRLAQALELKSLEGAVISQVEKGGPADKAGLKPYDVVIEMNGKKVSNPNELMFYVADSSIGSTAKLEVMREGRKRSISVLLAERPEPTLVRKGERKSPPKVKGEKVPFNFGLSIADSTAEIRNEFEIEASSIVPIIVAVEPDSLAQQVGLQVGDLILDVNRTEALAKSNMSLKASEIIKAFKKGTNTMRIQRGPAIIFITVDLK